MKTRIISVVNIPYLLTIVLIKLEYKIPKSFFKVEIDDHCLMLYGGLSGVCISTHLGRRGDVQNSRKH